MRTSWMIYTFFFPVILLFFFRQFVIKIKHSPNIWCCISERGERSIEFHNTSLISTYIILQLTWNSYSIFTRVEVLCGCQHYISLNGGSIKNTGVKSTHRLLNNECIRLERGKQMPLYFFKFEYLLAIN